MIIWRSHHQEKEGAGGEKYITVSYKDQWLTRSGSAVRLSCLVSLLLLSLPTLRRSSSSVNGPPICCSLVDWWSIVGHTRWHFTVYSVTILIFVCAKWLGKQLLMLRWITGTRHCWRGDHQYDSGGNLASERSISPRSRREFLFKSRVIPSPCPRISSSSADENVSGEGGRSWQ